MKEFTKKAVQTYVIEADGNKSEAARRMGVHRATIHRHLADETKALERQRIEEALATTYGNITEAGKLLGMSFRQLRYRLSQLRKMEEGVPPVQKGPVVYFLQIETEPHLIKLGTTTQLSRRIASLQSISPAPLRLLGTVPGGKDRETELKQQFRGSVHHGEWFSPTPELLDFIQKNAGREPEPTPTFLGDGI